MASAKRFAYLRDGIRNHPAIVASTAATAGVLLGGFVAVQLLDTSQPRTDGASAAQAAAEIKRAPKPVPETTGSAVAGDSVASAECDQQTWPYLSRVCMDDYRSKHRVARVVSTDKLDKQTIAAIESRRAETAAQASLAAPARWAPMAATIAPIAVEPTAPMTAGSMAQISATPAPAVAAPEPSPAVAAADAKVSSQIPTPSPPQGAKSEPRENHVAKKSKRKPKVERKAPVKPEFDDDNDSSIATAYSEDRSDDRIAKSRSARSRRIVDRWIERDYDVPGEGGRGRRRVTVIQRGGGGVFENLFGGFGN